MSPPATPPGARAVALEAIRRVVDEGAYSSILVPRLLQRSGLDARDKAFASDLAYGTLRHLLTLDAAIDARASRPVARMSEGARHVVRLGAYQLLFGGVAPHAAVSETVELAGARERGFTNAVLRRLADDPPAPAGGTSDEAIGTRTGLARWAVRELRRVSDDDTETVAAAFAARAPLALRTNTCRVAIEELEDALRRAGHQPHRSTVDPACLLVERGNPATLPGFGEGWFAVQDPASAFVVRALDPRPGERILDACAAPGGKALAMVCAVGEGGMVVAADLRHPRLGLVRSQAERLGLYPALLVQDATAPALAGPFDAVLVDAPCSGIGSARRRPELLWRVPKDDLSRLARTQVRITEAAAGLLRPGGRLVYSVCTFPRAETDAACDAIMRHVPSLRPVATDGPDGTSARHRLWPHLHGADGMFVASFRKAS